MAPARRSSVGGHRCMPGIKRKVGMNPQGFTIEMKVDIVDAK
jgi:hypothetical protein